MALIPPGPGSPSREGGPEPRLPDQRQVMEELTRTNTELANLVRELDRKNRELEQARDQIRAMGELVPICSCCKKIRNDKGFWDRIEKFLAERSDITLSHGFCPDCFKTFYSDELKG